MIRKRPVFHDSSATYVWGFHNRKGRFTEDIMGIVSVAALYERHTIVQNQNLLTFHWINSMPGSVK